MEVIWHHNLRENKFEIWSFLLTPTFTITIGLFNPLRFLFQLNLIQIIEIKLRTVTEIICYCMRAKNFIRDLYAQIISPKRHNKNNHDTRYMKNFNSVWNLKWRLSMIFRVLFHFLLSVNFPLCIWIPERKITKILRKC